MNVPIPPSASGFSPLAFAPCSRVSPNSDNVSIRTSTLCINGLDVIFIGARSVRGLSVAGVGTGVGFGDISIYGILQDCASQPRVVRGRADGQSRSRSEIIRSATRMASATRSPTREATSSTMARTPSGLTPLRSARSISAPSSSTDSGLEGWQRSGC